MSNIFLIVLFIAGFLIYLFDILAMTLTFNKTGSGKYSLFSFFPYELNPFRRHSKITYLYIILLVCGSISLALMLGCYCYLNSSSYVLWFIAILIFVGLVSFDILFFIKLSDYKLHVIFAVIFYATTFLSVILELLFLSKSDNKLGLIISTPIINGVITVVAIIILLVIALNPSYKTWSKMVKIDAQTYNRPKNNYLAILEWGTLIVHFLTYLPLIVSLF